MPSTSDCRTRKVNAMPARINVTATTSSVAAVTRTRTPGRCSRPRRCASGRSAGVESAGVIHATAARSSGTGTGTGTSLSR